jgi:hypothetical protein
MKTNHTEEKPCNNYYDTKLNNAALSEMKYLFEKNNWLRHPADIFHLFEPHSPSLRILWNRANQVELVYFFGTMISKKIIRVKGNRGFWSAIEKHLYDFYGARIKTSLSDLYNNTCRDKTMCARKTDEVDIVIKAVLEKIKKKKN